MGSLAADSISAIDVTLLFIERVRKIEKTAAASVDDIIAHNNTDFKNVHPVTTQNISAVIFAVSKTPIVAKSIVGLTTGLRLLLFVPNPPANNMNINAISANCCVNFVSSKYIIPVTSLPKIMPIANAIIINGTFNFRETAATKTINMSIKDVSNNIQTSKTIELHLTSWQPSRQTPSGSSNPIM